MDEAKQASQFRSSDVRASHGRGEGLLEAPEACARCTQLHYSETDHFVSLGMVVQRVESALSLDSLATNSLTSAVDRAKTFFQDHCTSELTRADDIETIQTFFKEMWSSVREEWFPVISGRAPLQAFPDVVDGLRGVCRRTAAAAAAATRVRVLLHGADPLDALPCREEVVLFHGREELEASRLDRQQHLDVDR
jgi:hypothetical protein